MTTRKTPPAAAAAAAARKRITKPGAVRTQPDRAPAGAKTAKTAKPKTEAKAKPAAAQAAAATADGKGSAKPPVSEAIAQAVRRAYDVIGENMAQGQAAAEHFRAGEYNIRDVPGDLNVLARRLITLTRDVSLAACDVLEQLMDDPRVMGAAKPAASGAEAKTSGAGSPSAAPEAFWSPPSPPGGKKGGAAAPAAAKAVAAKAATSAGEAGETASGGPPPSAVKLEVVFEGGKAVLRAGTFTPPKDPSPVFCPGLLGPEAAPPIRGVSFGRGRTPLDLKVTIKVPARQPPGLYSGAICAEGTQAPAGALTIEVLK
jgi:hypothetical protein